MKHCSWGFLNDVMGWSLCIFFYTFLNLKMKICEESVVRFLQYVAPRERLEKWNVNPGMWRSIDVLCCTAYAKNRIWFWNDDHSGQESELKYRSSSGPKTESGVLREELQFEESGRLILSLLQLAVNYSAWFFFYRISWKCSKTS